MLILLGKLCQTGHGSAMLTNAGQTLLLENVSRNALLQTDGFAISKDGLAESRLALADNVKLIAACRQGLKCRLILPDDFAGCLHCSAYQ